MIILANSLQNSRNWEFEVVYTWYKLGHTWRHVTSLTCWQCLSHSLNLVEHFRKLPPARRLSLSSYTLNCHFHAIFTIFWKKLVFFRFFFFTFFNFTTTCRLPKTQMSTLKKARHFEARRNFLDKIDTQPFIKTAIPLRSSLFRSMFSSFCSCNCISCLPKILVLPT